MQSAAVITDYEHSVWQPVRLASCVTSAANDQLFGHLYFSCSSSCMGKISKLNRLANGTVFAADMMPCAVKTMITVTSLTIYFS